VTHSCEDVLAALARLGSPKEVLMAQMEQIDSFKHPAQVVSMLPSLATVLTRVKVSNMSVSWTWALGTVGCHQWPPPPTWAARGRRGSVWSRPRRLGSVSSCARLVSRCQSR